MNNSTEDRSAVAEALVAARRAGRSLPGYPGTPPADMTKAYQIQELAMMLWPDTLVGWKIGYIAPERRSAGEPDRLVGPIWGAQCQQGTAEEHQGGAQSHEAKLDRPVIEMPVFSPGFAAVEAELVVRLKADVPSHPRSGWTADDVVRLDQELLFGIEVASSPIPDINASGPAVVASDFGNNNGLVLGPARPLAADPLSIELACYIDDQLVGRASGANLPGGMHHGLATALNVLERRGQRVLAGMVFATGAITGIHPIRPGQDCRVEVVGGAGVGLRTVQTQTAPSD